MDRSQNFRYFQLLVGLIIVFLLFRLLSQQSNDSNTGREISNSNNFMGGKPVDRGIQDRPPYEEPDKPVVNQDQDCSGLDISYIEENYYQLDQKDPQLIQYVRTRYLTPPSKLGYNMQGQKTKRSQHNEWVMKFFGKKKNGIFIEAGANEGGAQRSHTFVFEDELNWTGLLVECNPKVVPTLKTRHRKAWVGSVCLAPTTTPGVLNFSNPMNWTYSGTFRKPWHLPVKTEWEFFDVETIPLYTLLAALGWKEIDFFLFDIEGLELSIFKTFPFDEIIFKVMVVEVYFYKKDELKELNDLLESNGYIFVKKIDIDNVYVHNSVKHLIPTEITKKPKKG